MTDTTVYPPEEIEDIEACRREDRRPRDGAVYRVAIGDDRFEYKPFHLADPVPTGRQVVEIAGLHPADEFVVIKLRKDGVTEELRIDETVDLREPHVEKFLIFRGAEIYRLELDGRVFDWGASTIAGEVLKKLAKVDVTKFAVWQEIRGSTDVKIANRQLADLGSKGLERFFTGIDQTTEG